MKTIRQLSLIAVLAAMLCACSSLYKTVADHAAAIEAGMSKQEVINILGPTKYKSLDGRFEEWVYRSQLAGGDFDVVRIEFKDDCVVRMESYREVLPHYPESAKK